ncbi:DUF4936 family protein [Piscinibacter koreensis]|uniref:DUF4936 family protein n=1 Tax=Piscinibacter koreensis TaxID=2742824 RepID=A0A7Y6NRL8_9BURK|nr:DUF4936 family protein [Schlegelella koreensis]
MRELFVYYRVSPGNADAAYAAVDRLQTGLVAEFPGLQARVLRRPIPPNAPATALQTWMEVYAMDAQAGGAGVDESVQQAIETRAERVRPFIEGPRHVEAFETITPATP